MQRKKLSDILHNSEREQLDRIWTTTRAADDLKPIPGGEYRCRIVNGELFSAKSGTLGFKITLEVIGGHYEGRRVWHDIWLSRAAVAIAKRDLDKLRIKELEQLEQPLPEGIIVAARVTLRRNDDGSEFNRVARFEVVADEPPTPEPFAPEPDEGSTTDEGGFDWSTGTQGEDDRR